MAAMLVVVLKRSDGVVLHEGFPLNILKRCCNVGLYKFKQWPRLEPGEKATLQFTKKGEYVSALDACKHVIGWMESLQGLPVEKFPPIVGEEDSFSFIQLANVLKFCEEATIRPSGHRDQLRDTVLAKFNEVLAHDDLEPRTLPALVKVLPEKHVVVKSVMMTLTARFQEGKSTEKENEICAAAYEKNQTINKLFDEAQAQYETAKNQQSETHSDKDLGEKDEEDGEWETVVSKKNRKTNRNNK